MVSSTMPEDGNIATALQVSPAVGIPSGDYRLVGWDMDTTGKLIIDEICQIAAYTPGSDYSQYVMPFKNLSPPASKRHGIKVVTVGKYRVLKNSSTNKAVRTKSEIAALTDFLGWLEKVKGDASDGVILVHHEPRKVIPCMLIAALTRYSLLDRFRETVKGFANGFDIAKAKCGDSVTGFSIRILSRVFLNQEEELYSAVQRAKLALQIVHHLTIDEENGKSSEVVGSGDSDATAKATVESIREFVHPTSVEEKEIAALRLEEAIINNLKPIFISLLNVGRRDKQRNRRLRRLLAETGIDIEQLQEAWNSGNRDGVEKLVKQKVTADEKDIDDIVELIDCYFDPEKKKLKKVKPKESKVPKHEEQENGTTIVSTETPNSPDSTVCDLPVNNGSCPLDDDHQKVANEAN